MLRIAVAQITSSTEKDSNLAVSVNSMRHAHEQGAELIVFPEFQMAFSPASQTAAELAELAEPIEGPFVRGLCAVAKESKIAAVVTIYEKAPIVNRVYDTALWIDARGKIASIYRKLHLYDAFGFKESDKFQPGADIAPLISLGDGSFGVMICYDLRFPELARLLTLQGANILLAPSGWVQGDLKLDHWQTMIKARALENGCYLIAPDQVGNIYIGHSMAVDPLGRTLVDLGENEGVEVIDLDCNLVHETREKLPLLKNRRADVYSGSSNPKLP